MKRTNLIVKLVLLIVAISCLNSARSEALREVTNETLQKELKGFPWQSIAYVMLAKGLERTVQTGLLLSPSKLYISLDPRGDETLEYLCREEDGLETLVFNGQFQFKPDFRFRNQKPSFKCVDIQSKASPPYGFAVPTIKATREAPKLLVTPRLFSKGDTDLEGLEERGLPANTLTDYRKLKELIWDKSFTILGYAHSKEKGGVLKYATGCKIIRKEDPFEMSAKDKFPKLYEARWNWASINCPIEPAMNGAALLFQHRIGRENVWFVAGMVSLSDTDNVLFFPRVHDLRQSFSKLFAVE